METYKVLVGRSECEPIIHRLFQLKDQDHHMKIVVTGSKQSQILMKWEQDLLLSHWH